MNISEELEHMARAMECEGVGTSADRLRQIAKEIANQTAENAWMREKLGRYPNGYSGTRGQMEAEQLYVEHHSRMLNSVWPEVAEIADSARRLYGDYASAHEAYAVLLEEVHELWEFVKEKRSTRTAADICKEAMDIAAVAMRIANVEWNPRR